MRNLFLISSLTLHDTAPCHSDLEQHLELGKTGSRAWDTPKLLDLTDHPAFFLSPSSFLANISFPWPPIFLFAFDFLFPGGTLQT